MSDDLDKTAEEIIKEEMNMVEPIVEEIIKEGPKLVKPIFDMLKGAFKVLKDLPLRKDWPFTQKLSYEAAMKYFSEHQNDKPEIVKGAMLKEKTGGGGVRVYQVFLGKDNKLVEDELGRPVGCKIEAQSLDDELLAVFKDDDLVIVE